jgi:protein TonB
LSVYRLPSPYEQTPLQRRASGFGLALGVNLLLLLILMGLGIVAAPKRPNSTAITIDLMPESHSAASSQPTKAVVKQTREASDRPTPKPPPVILPVKPTIAPPPPAEKTQPWIEMSHDQLASADIRNLPKAGEGSAGDSEVVGRGPHGELLYNAEWAREPTNAELSGYLPPNPPDGWGLVECKTVAGDRVEDCIEIDQYPHGSHLAAAVRQAAWQFRVRPPRKGGKELIGSWVRILIDYSFERSGGIQGE